MDEVCACGAVGCLAAKASGRAMVRDLNRLGHGLRTSRDVVARVRRGDPDAVRVVSAAGRALGSVLSTAVSLLDPEVLAIGGDMAHANERLLGGIRETLLAQTQPLATAHLIVAPSRLKDHAGIMGATVGCPGNDLQRVGGRRQSGRCLSSIRPAEAPDQVGTARRRRDKIS
jgi:predicted NBD/HSP70 family sugar kinase